MKGTMEMYEQQKCVFNEQFYREEKSLTPVWSPVYSEALGDTLIKLMTLQNDFTNGLKIYNDTKL